MTHVAIIPARGGSQSIAGKNMALLGGKPLISHTFLASLQSKKLSRVLLSSDDEETIQHAKSSGIEVPFTRPAKLSAHDTPMVDVLQHALEYVELEAEEISSLVLLQPTSPFRTGSDIDAAISIFERENARSVVSVMKVSHSSLPQSVMKMHGTELSPFLGEWDRPTTRQKKEIIYARNGPAILVLSIDAIKSGNLYGERTFGYLMNKISSMDIDEPEDLALAECILSGGLI